MRPVMECEVVAQSRSSSTSSNISCRGSSTSCRGNSTSCSGTSISCTDTSTSTTHVLGCFDIKQLDAADHRVVENLRESCSDLIPRVLNASFCIEVVDVKVQNWPHVSIQVKSHDQVIDLLSAQVKIKNIQLNIVPAVLVCEVKHLKGERKEEYEKRIRSMFTKYCTKSVSFISSDTNPGIVMIRMQSALTSFQISPEMNIVRFETLPTALIELDITADRLSAISPPQILPELLETLLAAAGITIHAVDAVVSEHRINGCSVVVYLPTEADQKALVQHLPSMNTVHVSLGCAKQEDYAVVTEDCEKKACEPIQTEGLACMGLNANDIDASNTVFGVGEVSLRRNRAAYVLWDIEYCPLRRGDSAVTVISHIDQVVRYSVGYGWKCDHTTRFVFIKNYDPHNPLHPTPKQFVDLERWCTVVCSPENGSVEISVINEVDKIERRHRSDPVRPILCLLTGDRDLSGTLDKLKDEGFDDFVFIHTHDALPALRAYAPHTKEWKLVRCLDHISDRLSILSVPAHFKKAATNLLRTAPYFSLPSFSGFVCGELAPNCYNYSSTFSVLSRLRSVGWVVRDIKVGYDIATGQGLNFSRVDAESVELKRQSHARYVDRYILPELRNLHAYRDVEGIVYDRHVEIDHIDDQLVIRSPNIMRVKIVASELRSTVHALTRNSSTQVLQGWTSHHVDGFLYSKVLKSIEERFAVVIVIHLKYRHNTVDVEAEVCSDDLWRANDAALTLKRLQPSTQQWKLSPARLALLPRDFVDEVQKSHAVKIVMPTSRGKRDKEVTVYGFKGYIQQAHTKVVETSHNVRILKRLVCPSSESLGFQYLALFRKHFDQYVRHTWNVELLTEFDARDFHLNDARLFLRGASSQIDRASAYLSDVAAEVQSFEVQVTAENPFKLEEFANTEGRMQQPLAVEGIKTNAHSSIPRDPAGIGSPPLVISRMSPSMDVRAFHFMQFPLQIRFTFWAHKQHLEAVELLRQQVRSVDAEFHYEVVQCQPPINELAVQRLRHQDWTASFIATTKISGVLYDPSRGEVQLWGAHISFVEHAKRLLCEETERHARTKSE